MRPLAFRSTASGFTLIELLVALSLFALLGLLTWQATHHLTQARTRISDELARWRAITMAMHRIESEAAQMVPGADGLQYFAEGDAMLTPETPPPSSALVFSSAASADDAPGRMAFVLVGERLEWWLWSAPDAGAVPERVLLLDRVRSMRWHFLYRGDWLDVWPPETIAPQELPAALAINLEPSDAGNLVRILALR